MSKVSSFFDVLAVAINSERAYVFAHRRRPIRQGAGAGLRRGEAVMITEKITLLIGAALFASLAFLSTSVIATAVAAAL